jgi:predicted acylesterase/phospholipase RssA
VGFGGGAAHGLAGNSALAVLLDELGLRPHVKEVWGTSAGAVVGAAWAGGLPGRDILERMRVRARRPLDFAYGELFLRLLRRGGLPEGLIRGRHIREALERGMPVQRIEECSIPFRAIACTDDGRCRKVVFREGPLIPAVLASTAVPGVFFPVPDWNGAEYGYMDGGIVEKTPLLSIQEEHVRSGRATHLFVLCTHFDSEGRTQPPKGFLNRLLAGIHCAEDDAWTHQLERARATPGCRFVPLNPRMERGGMFEMEVVSFNYLWARRAFKEQLSNAGLPPRLYGR